MEKIKKLNNENYKIYFVMLSALFVCIFSISSASFWVDEGIRYSYMLNGGILEAVKGGCEERQFMFIIFEFIWSGIFGTSEIALRAMNIPFFLIATYYFIKILKKSNVSPMYGLLFIIQPLFVYYLNDLSPYIILAAAGTGMIYYTFFQDEKDVKSIAKANLFFLLGYAFHFIFAFCYFIYLSSALKEIVSSDRKIQALVKHIKVDAVFCIAYIPLTIVYLINMTNGIERGWDHPGFTNIAYVIYSFLGLQGLCLSRNDLRSLSFDNLDSVMIITSGLLVLAVVVIFCLNIKKIIMSVKNNLSFLLSLIIYAVVFFAAAWIMYFHFWERHYIVLFVGFLFFEILWIHYAWENKNKANKVFTAVFVILLLISSFNIRFNYYYQKDDYKGLLEYIQKEEIIDEEVVLVQGNYQLYDYYGVDWVFYEDYLSDTESYTECVFNVAHLTEDEIENLLLETIESDGKVCIILSEKADNTPDLYVDIEDTFEGLGYIVDINDDYNTFRIVRIME